MTSSVTGTVEIAVPGPFDLAAAAGFLEGFAPASRPDAAEEPGTLRLAFPLPGRWVHTGVRVRQRAPGSVEVTVVAGQADVEEAARHVARILSLDVDGSGFAAVGERDPVVGALQARYPGLRPVLFTSPYEAACWAIIGQRIRFTQAALFKQRIAERHGEQLDVDGRPLWSFPAPAELLEMPAPSWLPEIKVDRLRVVAEAALTGVLDPDALRAADPADALDALRALPGVGAFSAQLILIRGAGHPDVFPTDERYLLEEMRRAYDRPAASTTELASIADAWAPYRSWAALLFRVDRTHHPMPSAAGAATEAPTQAA
ncbi:MULTISPECIES: DNA-3-methyladenine glycosylase family protein [Amycolatopsis]|uniref:DNA-3-methyladenine glycosylase II n=1 Tax=Amycolatopsis thermalba TaxID=944492 RepID=A0ABY4P3C2_9PSEU|nr:MULTISPECIES: DNA-3-methyladenine glycosylase [Amycolatopsis]OXM71438.1 Fe-S cluster assembly protein HesB [Amycolatopsis sp. KNN50.9b]UQS26861.1 DNA-3-methyladenine glycosylase [Amycolatopsis thermalba]